MLISKKNIESLPGQICLIQENNDQEHTKNSLVRNINIYLIRIVLFSIGLFPICLFGFCFTWKLHVFDRKTKNLNISGAQNEVPRAPGPGARGAQKRNYRQTIVFFGHFRLCQR